MVQAPPKNKSRRNKAWGREVENAALRALLPIFPTMRRTGSVNYRKAAPDLVQEGYTGPLNLVVTRDKYRPLLITLSVEDFVHLLTAGGTRENLRTMWVRVQCKGREATWIGRIYGELKAAND